MHQHRSGGQPNVDGGRDFVAAGSTCREFPAQRQKGRESGPVKLVAMPDEVKGAAKIPDRASRPRPRLPWRKACRAGSRKCSKPETALDRALDRLGMPRAPSRTVSCDRWYPEGMIEGFRGVPSRSRAGSMALPEAWPVMPVIRRADDWGTEHGQFVIDPRFDPAVPDAGSPPRSTRRSTQPASVEQGRSVRLRGAGGPAGIVAGTRQRSKRANSYRWSSVANLGLPIARNWPKQQVVDPAARSSSSTALAAGWPDR